MLLDSSSACLLNDIGTWGQECYNYRINVKLPSPVIVFSRAGVTVLAQVQGYFRLNETFTSRQRMKKQLGVLENTASFSCGMIQTPHLDSTNASLLSSHTDEPTILPVPGSLGIIENSSKTLTYYFKRGGEGERREDKESK